MYKLVEKLQKLEPYQPITEEYKIRLDANESFIRLTDDELKKAVEGVALNRYPDPYACEAVRAFADYFGINPENVTAGNGSDELISIITACFLEKGSKVLCFSPDFSMYSFYPYLYELDVSVMPKKDDLTIDVDKAIEYCNKNRIECVMFSNPCNPTSLGLAKKDVIRLIENVEALVVVDEAYMDFWDMNESVMDEVGKYDNLMVLKTCSKALAMAGLRLGFAVADKQITNALRAAKSPYNVNSITQAVAAHILKDKDGTKQRINAVKQSASKLYDMIIKADLSFAEVIYKPVTNFVFIKSNESKKVFEYLLSKSIAVRFMGDFLRITCGTDEENFAVTEALKSYKA